MAGGLGDLADAVRRGGAWLADAIFPQSCAACGRRDTPFCEQCAAALSTSPERRVLRDGTVAVGFTPYADPRVRSLIGAYKFHSRTQLAAALGEVLARAASASPTLLPDSAVLLVPIPLQRRRERERGFNQAEEIARLLQPRLPAGSEIVSPLVRARKTAQQASLAKADRRANVAGAFRAIGACDEGKTYLLVDDVMTSGETLVAAAQALRSAGARTIRAITLAYGSDD